MFKKINLAGVALILVLTLALTACGNNNNAGSTNTANNSNATTNNNGGSSDNANATTDNSGADNASQTSGTELGKKDITIPYVAWAGAVARTFLMKAVLEDAGYNVTVSQVQAGAMFTGTAGGSADFFMAGWLPITHKSYWEKYQDDLEKVSVVIDKAPLGLTVPTYMENVNSIEDLKGNTEIGEATNWTLTGIDPGAGEMEATKTVLKEYGLDKWSLQSSSEAGMLSALKKAAKDKKPIVVTLWKPHWAFGQWDLKILKDPKKIYGEADKVYVIARKGFKEDSPAAYQIIKQFSDNYGGDIEDPLMVKIHDGTEAEEAGQQFVKDHPDLVKEWEAGIAKAE